MADPLSEDRVIEGWRAVTSWLEAGYGLESERRRAETLAALCRDWFQRQPDAESARILSRIRLRGFEG